jgi:hypothetical protein
LLAKACHLIVQFEPENKNMEKLAEEFVKRLPKIYEAAADSDADEFEPSDEWSAETIFFFCNAFSRSSASSHILLNAIPLVQARLAFFSHDHLPGIANSYSKLDAFPVNNSKIKLFSGISREICRLSEPLSARNWCVLVNAFAAADVLDQRLFLKCTKEVPEILPEFDSRQVSMLIHAYVRVGLLDDSLLPLAWNRCTMLVNDFDLQSSTLLMRAYTKSVHSDPHFLLTMMKRVHELLPEKNSDVTVSTSRTMAVAVFALAKAYNTSFVYDEAAHAPHLEKLLGVSAHTASKMEWSELGNTATAWGEICDVTGFMPYKFFDRVLPRLERERQLSPAMLQRFVVAFSHVCGRKPHAGYTESMQNLLRRHVLLIPQFTPIALERVASAVARLQILDEDLISALTSARRESRRASASNGTNDVQIAKCFGI